MVFNLEQRPALQTRVEEQPHPSGGRGFAYSQDMRLHAVNVYLNGHIDDPMITDYTGSMGQTLSFHADYQEVFTINTTERTLQTMSKNGK